MFIKKINIIITFFLSSVFILEGGEAVAVELAKGDAIDYLLPEDSWLHENLDKIFSDRAVLENSATFEKAGFVTLHRQPSGMRVASHPLLPGYLIKAYLSSSSKNQQEKWLVERCRGAENIRRVIREEKLKHFVVPDKWIYYTSREDAYAAILVVQHMKILPPAQSKEAWRKVSKKEVKEFHAVVGKGFGSIYLHYNVPKMKNGKFAFIDTAYPHRKYDFSRLKGRLSPEMYEYFCELCKKGKKK